MFNWCLLSVNSGLSSWQSMLILLIWILSYKIFHYIFNFAIRNCESKSFSNGISVSLSVSSIGVSIRIYYFYNTQWCICCVSPYLFFFFSSFFQGLLKFELDKKRQLRRPLFLHMNTLIYNLVDTVRLKTTVIILLSNCKMPFHS